MPTVASIIGQGFCGSTFVNQVLGAHPAIFGGGELQRLMNPDRQPVCAVCGKQCAFWTEAFVAELHGAISYQKIMDRAGVDVVLDASKPPAWTVSMAEERQNYSLLDIVLTKHPMRQLSSMVDNLFLRKAQLLSEIKGLDKPARDQVMLDSGLSKFIADALFRLAKTYNRGFQPFEPNDQAPLQIKYEDVAANRRDGTAPILQALGLEFAESMDDYVSADQHGLGGNSGANYIIKRETRPDQQKRWLEKNTESDNLSIFKGQYYGRDALPSVDNKFLAILPPKIIEDLQTDETYRSLCELMNYDNVPFPLERLERQ